MLKLVKAKFLERSRVVYLLPPQLKTSNNGFALKFRVAILWCEQSRTFSLGLWETSKLVIAPDPSCPEEDPPVEKFNSVKLIFAITLILVRGQRTKVAFSKAKLLERFTEVNVCWRNYLRFIPLRLHQKRRF